MGAGGSWKWANQGSGNARLLEASGRNYSCLGFPGGDPCPRCCPPAAGWGIGTRPSPSLSLEVSGKLGHFWQSCLVLGRASHSTAIWAEHTSVHRTGGDETPASPPGGGRPWREFTKQEQSSVQLAHGGCRPLQKFVAVVVVLVAATAVCLS